MSQLIENPTDFQPSAEEKSKKDKKAAKKKKRRANGEGSMLKQVIKTPGKPDRIRYRAIETLFISSETKQAVRVSGFGSTKTEARRNLAKNRDKRKVMMGTLPLSVLSIPKTEMKLTVGEYLNQWLSGQSHLKPPTVRNYRNTLQLHVIPELGNIPLRLLDYTALVEFFTKTLPGKKNPKTGEPLLSTNSQRNVFTVLNLSLKNATEGDTPLIPKNPMANIETRKKPKRVEPDHSDMVALRYIPRVLMRYLEGTEEEFRWWCSFSSMRQSEKLGLTWDCLKRLDDKNLAYIEIRQTLRRNEVAHGCGPRNKEGDYPCGENVAYRCPQKTEESGYFISTDMKSSSSRREIPIPPRVLPALKRWKKINEEYRKSPDWKPTKGMEELLWNRPDGTFLTQQMDSRDWKALLAHPNPKDPTTEALPFVRQHANRHFAISDAVSLGQGISSIKSLSGHAPSSKVTEATYTHLSREDNRQVINAITEKMYSRSDEEKEREARKVLELEVAARAEKAAKAEAAKAAREAKATAKVDA